MTKTQEAAIAAIEEQQKIEAAAAAEIKKINADAAAYEIIAEAEAEAEANTLISQSLTNELISYAYANKWDGKLPTYMAGDEETVPVFSFNTKE